MALRKLTNQTKSVRSILLLASASVHTSFMNAYITSCMLNYWTDYEKTILFVNHFSKVPSLKSVTQILFFISKACSNHIRLQCDRERTRNVTKSEENSKHAEMKKKPFHSFIKKSQQVTVLFIFLRLTCNQHQTLGRRIMKSAVTSIRLLSIKQIVMANMGMVERYMEWFDWH